MLFYMSCGIIYNIGKVFFMLDNKWINKKIVLFDLDGTLTDPGIGITNSVMYALEKYGIALPERSELYKFIGPPLSESFERFYDFSPEEAVHAVEVYREYFSVKGLFENELYEGIENMLKTLKQQGKLICLATSKPEIFAKKILEYFHIDHYFDYISGSLLSGERTDKSEVITHVLQCLEIDGQAYQKDEIVMVGDREHDVIGAHKNDLDVIGVLYGYGTLEEFNQAGADEIVASVDELHTILTNQK